MKARLRVYWALGAIWGRAALRYRVNTLFRIVSLLLQIYLLKVVWTAVYRAHPHVTGTSLPALITYLTVVNLQMWALSPGYAGILPARIGQGLIAIDLVRPVPFLGQAVVATVGRSLAIAPFVVVALPFAYAIGGLHPPVSFEAGVLYVVSVLLGFGVSLLLGLLIGMIAFWTLQVTGFLVIYDFVGGFFAGTLVPLWLFPPALRVLANVLPFQARGFVPVAMYIGQLRGSQALAALGLQVFWIVALYLLARLVGTYAMRRVTSQGG